MNTLLSYVHTVSGAAAVGFVVNSLLGSHVSSKVLLGGAVVAGLVHGYLGVFANDLVLQDD